MPRYAPAATLRAASLAALVMIAAPVFAQKPQKPLGELLDVIPLPEERAGNPSEAAPPSSPPSPPPAARPGGVVPVDLPPSAATGEIAPDEELATTDPAAPKPEPIDPAAVDAAAAAAAEADRSWAELQEQRRQKVNSVEAPIVAGLNAEMAARAEADGRRFAAEQEAYERSLVARQEEIRRSEAEHQAAIAEHARRVAREQAEYQARVEACRAGRLRACRGDDER